MDWAPAPNRCRAVLLSPAPACLFGARAHWGPEHAGRVKEGAEKGRGARPSPTRRGRRGGRPEVKPRSALARPPARRGAAASPPAGPRAHAARPPLFTGSRRASSAAVAGPATFGFMCHCQPGLPLLSPGPAPPVLWPLPLLLRRPAVGEFRHRGRYHPRPSAPSAVPGSCQPLWGGGRGRWCLRWRPRPFLGAEDEGPLGPRLCPPEGSCGLGSLGAWRAKERDWVEGSASAFMLPGAGLAASRGD